MRVGVCVVCVPKMTAITETNAMSKELRAVLETAITLKLSQNEIVRCLDDAFNRRKRRVPSSVLSNTLSFLINAVVCLSLIIVVSRFLRKVYWVETIISDIYDDYTYAVLRTARIATMPVLARFPTLARYHHVKCLVENPLFSPLNKTHCWPCQNLKAVVDLSGHPSIATDYTLSGTPFVIRDGTKLGMSLKAVQRALELHGDVLSDPTSRFESSLDGMDRPENLVDARRTDLLRGKMYHVFWRTNSVSSARIMRRMFPRPYFVPRDTEVSLQRSLLIDGPREPSYVLPEADFANTWLVQAEGTRIVVLEPSDICATNCSTVSVLLKPGDVLYYNSQISKPRSVPTRLTEAPSVAYMASFY